jgi:hypothetical protein
MILKQLNNKKRRRSTSKSFSAESREKKLSFLNSYR